VAPIDVEVKLGAATVVGVGVDHAAPRAMDAATSRAGLEAVDAYVQAALVAPLEGRAVKLDGLVGMGAAARLAEGQHDRAVLTTEGLPDIDEVAATLRPVRLVGLTEGFGTMPLISASIEFTADLATEDGPLKITHLGELVLTNDHGWKLIGYEMVVIRDDGNRTTTTTATVTP
jgi:hypothetical protein